MSCLSVCSHQLEREVIVKLESELNARMRGCKEVPSQTQRFVGMSAPDQEVWICFLVCHQPTPQPTAVSTQLCVYGTTLLRIIRKDLWKNSFLMPIPCYWHHQCCSQIPSAKMPHNLLSSHISLAVSKSVTVTMVV